MAAAALQASCFSTLLALGAIALQDGTLLMQSGTLTVDDLAPARSGEEVMATTHERSQTQSSAPAVADRLAKADHYEDYYDYDYGYDDHDQDDDQATVSTTLTSAASAGESTLVVASTVGFSVGCTVEIEGGGNSETGVVASIGSLVLTSGLENGYPAGTTSVTLIATPAVSAIADPHLVNMRGERFDIYQPGNFVLLQLPRGAEPASTLLQVEAGARVMGGPCYVYFQVVTISGAWTNQTEPLLFTADPQSKPSTFNSAQWMHFGPVSVKVIHWRNKAPDFVDFLDIYAKNVGLTGLTVGGLLGSDDHKELAPRPRQCSRERGVATSSSFAEARS